jgi:hypothetical protein
VCISVGYFTIKGDIRFSSNEFLLWGEKFWL